MNYEVKGVSQAPEIKKAYEEAVKGNAPKYRAVSKTNQFYGWDEKANKFIKAEIGQEWFDNPHYVAPIETVEEPIEEMVEVANEMVEEVVAENTTTEKVDYKALYEEKCVELDKLGQKLNKVEQEVKQAKEYATHYSKENAELKAGLQAFKNLLNKV